MYEHILVPTDGSLTAQRAVDHAAEQAADDNAELHALRIVRESTTVPGSDPPRMTEADARLQEEAREELDTALKGAEKAGVDVHKAVMEHATIAEGILSYADEHDVDIIFMGTHGRSNLERFLLGSVADRVIRKSPLPVVLIPPKTAA